MDGQNNKAFEDIANALHGVRRAFLKHGMDAPVSLELGDVRDSYRFRHLLPHDMIGMRPVVSDDRADAEWVCNVVGIDIRLPAEWRRDLDGKARMV